jgi:hypothetical protein
MTPSTSSGQPAGRTPGSYQQQSSQASGQPAVQKTNIWAILGIIFGFLIPILGIVFSIIALVQIKKTGEKGKGLAIAGLVIGILISLFWIGVVLILFMGLAFIGQIASSGMCIADTGFECEQNAITSDGAVSFNLTNMMGEAIQISGFKGGESGDCMGSENNQMLPAGITLGKGQTAVLTYTPPAARFDREDLVGCGFEIAYTGSNGIEAQAPIYVTGTIS